MLLHPLVSYTALANIIPSISVILSFLLGRCLISTITTHTVTAATANSATKALPTAPPTAPSTELPGEKALVLLLFVVVRCGSFLEGGGGGERDSLHSSPFIMHCYTYVQCIRYVLAVK